MHVRLYRLCYFEIITPPRGIVIERFLSLFVSLSATLRENGCTDLHEIFRECVEWPWDDLIQFWVISGKRVGGSKVKLFVITGRSSDCCYLANDNDLLTQVIVIRFVAARVVITGHSSEALTLTSHYHSQQGAGFVVSRTTACYCLYSDRNYKWSQFAQNISSYMLLSMLVK